MTEHSLWRFSRAFHRAINERQPADLETLLDEDVDWAIYGPVDMYPFFGSRRGKAAVIDVIRQIADNFRVHRFDRKSIMLGADTASSMMRYSLTAPGFEQADLVADRPFRPVQGRPPDQFPRAGRHLRPGRTDGGLSDPAAADGGVALIHDSNRHARAREQHLRAGIHVFLRQPQGGVHRRVTGRDHALCPAMTFIKHICALAP